MAPAIRQAGPTDAALFAAMSASCFAEAWSEDLLARLLAQPAVIGLLAADAAGPAGFVLAMAGPDLAEILLIATLPEYRRRGIGRALLEAALAEARSRGARRCLLEVAADDAPAVLFYRSAGFARDGLRRGYYVRPGGPVDALVMGRELPGQEVQ